MSGLAAVLAHQIRTNPARPDMLGGCRRSAWALVGCARRDAAAAAPSALSVLQQPPLGTGLRCWRRRAVTVGWCDPRSRVAFPISWLVFAVAVVLAWRKVLAAPNGDINRLLVAPLRAVRGLALLGAWLQDHERDR